MTKTAVGPSSRSFSCALSTTAASIVVKIYSLLPGHAREQADAEMADTQAAFTGTQTWFELPKEQRRRHDSSTGDHCIGSQFAGSSRYAWAPGCRGDLGKTLRRRSLGFVEIEKWRSVYFHKKKVARLLVVYVGDFKMAGPWAYVPVVWERFAEQSRWNLPGLVLGLQP